MEICTPTALTTALILSLATGVGATTYDESVDGDLSGAEGAPTAIAFGVGTHSVIGSTVSTPDLDRDFFTFTIAAGETLTSIELAGYTSNAEPSFFGLDDQVGFTDLTNPTEYVGFLLINFDDIGTNILPEVSGSAAPLGPGDYTVWYQETGGETTYQWDFTVVPEPGSAALLLVGATCLLRRRRQA